MLADSKRANDTLAGKRVAVSGSGNVAQYCAQKLTELGAKVVTLSDSSGWVYEPNGFTPEQIAQARAVQQGHFAFARCCRCQHHLPALPRWLARSLRGRGRLCKTATVLSKPWRMNRVCPFTVRAAGEWFATRTQVMHLKNVKRGRMSEYAALTKSATAVYTAGASPWGTVKCDVAAPCATQNEIGEADAAALVANGARFVVEGANMPTTAEGTAVFEGNGVVFGPAKAANAGGVSVSGLEMAQNSARLAWTREEVDRRLKDIMNNIYKVGPSWRARAREGGRECFVTVLLLLRVRDDDFVVWRAWVVWRSSGVQSETD